MADSNTSQQERSRAESPVTTSSPQNYALTIGGFYTHRADETAGWIPNAAIDYAATDRLQLHAMIPLAFDRLRGGSTHYGLGDIEAGFRYRFFDENPRSWEPSAAIYPLVEFPTGNANENLGTGHVHAFLPIWIAKTFGKWTPYIGGGYWINPGVQNRNWFFAEAGTLRELTSQWTVFGEIFHATSSKVGLRQQTGFDVGARYNFNEHHHVVVTLGSGLQNVSQTNEFTGYAAYIFTF